MPTFSIQKNKSGNVTVFLIVIILLLMTLVIMFGIKLFGKTSSLPTPLDQQSSPFTPKVVVEDNKPVTNTMDTQLVYVKDQKLYLLASDLSSKEITGFTGSVFPLFSYDKSIQKIAFLAGFLQEQKYGHTNVWPTQVYLYDVRTNKSSLIYELNSPIEDCGESLKSVLVSPDGKYTAISTKELLVLYDNELKKEFKQYKFPVTKENGPLCAYKAAAFSPDNRHIILEKIYFEGYEDIILNLDTGNLIAKGFFSGYVFGKKIHGWLDNETIIYSVRSDDTSLSEEELSVMNMNAQQVILYKSTLSNLNSPTQLSQTFKGYLSNVRIINGSAIFILNQEIQNAGGATLQTIYKLNLNTKDIVELYKDEKWTDDKLVMLDLSVSSNDQLYTIASAANTGLGSLPNMYIFNNGKFTQVPDSFKAVLSFY